MRNGGLIDDLPMDEDEMEDPRNTHYQMVEPRFRPPTGGGGGKSTPAGNKQMSKGTMRQFAEPSAPSRLEAHKLWPGERSPEGADHLPTPLSNN